MTIAPSPALASPPAPGRGVAAWVVGPLLVVMAATQLSDPSGFVDILTTYRVGGRTVAWVLAALIIAGEVVGGIGLLSTRRARRRVGADVALAVTVGWSLLGLSAFARGLALESCGCFGVHLPQPLRWWVLVQDAEFVALAVFARRRIWRAAPPVAQGAGEHGAGPGDRRVGRPV